jgi:hypothetical protein
MIPRISRRHALVLVLAIAGCSPDAGNNGGRANNQMNDTNEFESLDDSGTIQTLRYEVSESQGFCIDFGTPSVVVIEEGDGGFTIEGEFVFEGETDDDGECLDTEDFWGTCMRVEPFGPAALPADDVAEVEDILRDVPGKTCTDDPDTQCDFCSTTSLDVNGHSVRLKCCPNSDETFEAAFRKVEGKLHELANSARQ